MINEMNTTATHQIGDLVWVLVNEGRGVSLGRLESRHDEDSWDVNLHFATSWPGRTDTEFVVVPETDFRPNPFDRH